MQSQLSYDNLEANRELIHLSMRFTRLSDRKKEVLRILAEKDYLTNKQIAEVIGCTHNTVSSFLSELRNEGWLESQAYSRNAYWFFVDDRVKTFIQWECQENDVFSCEYADSLAN